MQQEVLIHHEERLYTKHTFHPLHHIE